MLSRYYSNIDIIFFNKIKQDIHIYMLGIAGQTAGPNGLNFLVNTYQFYRLKNWNSLFKILFIIFLFSLFSTGHAGPFSLHILIQLNYHQSPSITIAIYQNL